MKSPKKIETLHRAVATTSNEDFQSACSWLRSQNPNVVESEEVSQAFAALKTLKAFFDQIERVPD